MTQRRSFESLTDSRFQLPTIKDPRTKTPPFGAPLRPKPWLSEMLIIAIAIGVIVQSPLTGTLFDAREQSES